MREIIFDTETTGLDSRQDRIIEIGAIEMVNRFPTGNVFHEYIHPGDRAIHPDAEAVHGISMTQLAGKPNFAGIAARFIEFIAGAKMIAHNAGFDIGFINAEFDRLGHPPVDGSLVIDTLALARRKHPMGPNSLDALCKRYGIDNSRRAKHGALLDSELLAEVYIELIGGKQASMTLDVAKAAPDAREVNKDVVYVIGQRPAPLKPRLTEADIAAHERLVTGLGEKAIWNALLARQQ